MLIFDLDAGTKFAAPLAAALDDASGRPTVHLGAHRMFTAVVAGIAGDGPVRARLSVVSAMPLFARAIRDCHDSWQG